MILSGEEIVKQIDAGNIVIDPFLSSRVNPNSYNLRLADELIVYTGAALDMKLDNPFRRIKIPENGLVLEPGKVYLGRTVEHTETRGFVPMLEGRSSIGRLGLTVHVTAGFGDVGFNGCWTLELHCVQSIRVYAGVEICQIYYHTIAGDWFEYGDGGKYQNASEIQTSQLFKEFQREND